jgi:hypothetical protein
MSRLGIELKPSRWEASYSEHLHMSVRPVENACDKQNISKTELSCSVLELLYYVEKHSSQYTVKKVNDSRPQPGCKAVNREDKRSRRYRDRHFAKIERSRRC